MTAVGILLLAIALAADSFAASIAKGANLYRPTLRQALLVAAVFALAQIVMPFLGWRVGVSLRPVIERWDHWIAFGILVAIGAKLIYDGLRSEGEVYRRNALTIYALVLSAIATSIDSLVVGFGFGFLDISILVALATIGAVTFVVSFGGVYLGRAAGHHMGDYVEVGAGAILIMVGSGILYDHLSTGPV